MRAGMEDERVRDALRSHGLPGMPSREDGKPRARCRARWGVGSRAAQGFEAQSRQKLGAGRLFECRSCAPAPL